MAKRMEDAHPPRETKRPKTDLRSLESRLDQLEGDVDAVLAGGSPSPLRRSRAAVVSRWLIVGGIALIVAAIIFAIY